MDEHERRQLLERAKDFFRDNIVDTHINSSSVAARRLNNYNVNPFLFKYLANFLRGNGDARSIAEALVLPRLLGSSITTSFGMRIQSMINELFEGFGSLIPGVDIEFVDALDDRRKYCQLKSGPNTINHHDVETIIAHFQGTRNLARTNGVEVGLNDMMVGIIYGERDDLNSHYDRLNATNPVIIGQEFWHRLTGDENFYLDLINAFGNVALEVDGTTVLEETIAALTIEIEEEFGL